MLQGRDSLLTVTVIFASAYVVEAWDEARYTCRCVHRVWIMTGAVAQGEVIAIGKASGIR